MTEGVNSTNISYAKSSEERQQMYAEWRKKLTQDNQTNQRLKYMTNENAKTKSAFLSNADMKERESRFLSNADMPDKGSIFLSNEDMAERKSAFITDDMLPQERPEVFLSNDINAERQSVFLEVQRDTQNAQSPLEITREETEEAQDTEAVGFTLPKNDSQIISELKRDPMLPTLTPHDIANRYSISYQKAMNIYTALNEDENGIVKEFNLPQNATVSYLV